MRPPGNRYILRVPRDVSMMEEREMYRRAKEDWLRPGETLVALREGFTIGRVPDLPAKVRRARATAR
jgi:hypothetical protein